MLKRLVLIIQGALILPAFGASFNESIKNTVLKTYNDLETQLETIDEEIHSMAITLRNMQKNPQASADEIKHEALQIINKKEQKYHLIDQFMSRLARSLQIWTGPNFSANNYDNDNTRVLMGIVHYALEMLDKAINSVNESQKLKNIFEQKFRDLYARIKTKFQELGEQVG